MIRKHTFNRKKIYKCFIIFLPYIFILCDFSFLSLYRNTNLSKIKPYVGETSIQVYYDQQLTKKVELPFYGNDNNQSYDFYIKLPDVTDTDTVYISSRYTKITAEENNQIFFESQTPALLGLKTYTDFNKCFLPLKKEFSNKIICFHINFQHNLYKAGLTGIEITNLPAYVNKELRKNLPFCSMAILLFVSAFISFISYIITSIFKKQMHFNNLSGFLKSFNVSLCISIWMITSPDITGVILGNTAAISLLNYVSFLLLPITFSSFLLGIYEKSKKLLKVLYFTSILNFILQNLFYLSQIFDFTQMLFVTHIVALAAVISTVFVTVDIVLQKEFTLQHKVFCAGAGCFAFCAILSIISYVINSNGNFMFIISIGVFLFFGTHMIASTIKISTNTKNELKLQKDSYKDQLTGLGNRRLYTEKLEHISFSKIPTYTNFVMMDVNGLKFTNDTKGHDAGDELLRGTSKYLSLEFCDADIICRIGGDEFFLIINEDQIVLENRIKKFLKIAENHKGVLIDGIYISYGISNAAKNPDASLEELIKIADKEMYLNKAEFYKNNSIFEQRKR